MNELLLDSLLKIFAYIANTRNEQIRHLTQKYVELYLSRLYRPFVVKQKLDDFTAYYTRLQHNPESINIADICTDIVKDTSKGQRVLFVTNLIEFVVFTEQDIFISPQIDHPLKQLIEKMAIRLKISAKTLLNCQGFVSNQIYRIPSQEYLVIGKNKDPRFSRSRFIQIDGINGYFVFFYIDEANLLLFKYLGSSILSLNSKVIFPKNIYVFRSGAVIAQFGKPLVYYSQVVNAINAQIAADQVSLSLRDVSYSYPKSSFGLKEVNFTCTSGELIGVIGGSGSGKSTLFNVINGNITPDKGKVLLNGNLYTEQLQSIQRLIGFVPQDDSLFDELTVYENLYYTARLSANSYQPDELSNLLDSRLSEFGLYHIRNNRVGSVIDRKISGGQRKRLNIVSEIVHNPLVLLVDEPTSGLSSLDSFRVMSLLKDQSYQGKLVIVNIHQPSTDIYRMFDKVLVLDQQGYMAYFGNPLQAVEYFRMENMHVDPSSVECERCGTIKSDEIFDVIEEKEVDEYGEYLEKRKREPNQWSALFKKNTSELPVVAAAALPKPYSSSPQWTQQLLIFLSRILHTKIRDKEFFSFAFLVPMILSVIISFFAKYYQPLDNGEFEYSFYENINIPVFFLMSIVANLFIGTIIASDSIIKESNIVKREKFLFLSRTAYLNSKVILYAMLSALQSLLFTLVAFVILRIPDLFLSFWLVLFMMSLFGNLSGLIISSIFTSLSAVYIIVPFLVIPQILFSGIVIPFDKFHYSVANRKEVPLIGNVMISRWGMESLLVSQFQHNQYQKHFFDVDQKESILRIRAYFLIPKLQTISDELAQTPFGSRAFNRKRLLLEQGLTRLNLSGLGMLSDSVTLRDGVRRVGIFLESEKSQAIKELKWVKTWHDQIADSLSARLGSTNELLALRSKFANKGIEDLVLNRKSTKVVEIRGKDLVQVTDPIYLLPESTFGGSHFLASSKLLGSKIVPTFRFNLMAMFLFVAILYLVLISNFSNKLPVRFRKG
ncbi:MAG: ATP-binding cassette domain-containing protein [Bacteroidales bacterium]|nr:ATP-binding cassette domain-containing protein [Bacteroidales bacterium]MBN2750714.1 ATP-binding cassette domain-containing protein [Bacteroidales bacterium]